jgi:hypothetical protein
MDFIEDYISELSPTQATIIMTLHRILLSYPGITCRKKYGIPFYYKKSWICYLIPVNDQKIEIAFIRGNELSNMKNILESRNRKQVMGIILSKVTDHEIEKIEFVLQEAILLDDKLKYGSKRSSGKSTS